MRNYRVLSGLAALVTLACVAPALSAERPATILSVQGNLVTIADAAGSTTTLEVVDATGLARGGRVWCEDDCRSLRMGDRSIPVRSAVDAVTPRAAPGFPAMPQGVPGFPQGVPGMANPQAMLAQLESAQAAARQPGDEKLSCDELQTQMAAAANDPAVAAHVAQAGAAAQQDVAALQAGQARLAAPLGGAIAGAAGALIPGGDMATIAAQAAQAQAMQAQAAQRMQSHTLLAQQSAAMMPQLMRGQRLVELAVVKQCAWATGAGAAPIGVPLPKNDERQR